VHLVSFIIRIYHDARSHERQMCYILVRFILLDVVFATLYCYVLLFDTECMYNVVIVITEPSIMAKTVKYIIFFFKVSVGASSPETTHESVKLTTTGRRSKRTSF